MNAAQVLAKVIDDLAADPGTTVTALAEAADQFGFDPLEVLALI